MRLLFSLTLSLIYVYVGFSQAVLPVTDELKPWANPKGRQGQDTKRATVMLFNHWLFRKHGMQQIFDGFPYYFKNPRTGVEAFFCLCEKVGSTAWKSMLIKALNPKYFSSHLTKPGTSSHSNVPNLPTYTADFYRAKLNNASIPRIMFVRNPYSRVVSGWNGNTDQMYYATFNRSHGLEAFVYHLRDNRFTLEKEVNDHFYPLVNKCMQPLSMTYDYFLKVEQIDFWYAPLIRMLELEPEASSGWTGMQHVHHGDSAQDCFYVPAGQTCDTALTANHTLGAQDCSDSVKIHASPTNVSTLPISPIPPTTSTNANVTRRGLRESSDKLPDSFTNAKMIEAVNLYAWHDFNRYGYVRERNGTLNGYLERLKCGTV